MKRTGWNFGMVAFLMALVAPATARAQQTGPVSVQPTGQGVSVVVSTSKVKLTVTFQRGDTVASIALGHGISIDLLRSANPQIADLGRVLPGDILNIPSLPTLGTGTSFPGTPPFVPVGTTTGGLQNPVGQTPTTLQTPSVYDATQYDPSTFNPSSVDPSKVQAKQAAAAANTTQPVASTQRPVANTQRPVANTQRPVTTNTTRPTTPVQSTQRPTVAQTQQTQQQAQTQAQAPQATETWDDDNVGVEAIEAIKSGRLVNPNTGNNNWNGWCRALVRAAFRRATGRDLPELSAGNSAWASYQAFEREGLIQHGPNPPRGAIVFWSPAARAAQNPGSLGAIYGHIAISNGDGTVISNGRHGINPSVRMAAFGTVTGWVVIQR